LESQPEIDAGAAQHEIEYALDQTMEQDEGSGPWVAVLGFSQGAKLAASLLYNQQLNGDAGPWKYAVIFAGRAPMIALNEESETYPWMQSAGGLTSGVDVQSIADRPHMKLRIPTLHVHGLKDEGLSLHRILVENYCAPGTTTLVEWDGPHRLAVKRSDVDNMIDAWVKLADEYGV
jgi:predicted esterase